MMGSREQGLLAVALALLPCFLATTARLQGVLVADERLLFRQRHRCGVSADDVPSPQAASRFFFFEI